ncbi:MAG: ATP-binding protein [Aliidongia sp.]
MARFGSRSSIAARALRPAEIERVFDKFYRAEAADRRNAGTGLGLAICRGFVEAMGGRIGAGNRRDGLGAVFTIWLPIPDAEIPDDRDPRRLPL